MFFLGGSTYTDNKNVELNEQVSVITIDSTGVGGDNILNIPEWSSGLTIFGTSNAKSGSTVQLKLLKASDNSELPGFDNVTASVDDSGKWTSNSLPSEPDK